MSSRAPEFSSWPQIQMPIHVLPGVCGSGQSRCARRYYRVSVMDALQKQDMWVGPDLGTGRHQPRQAGSAFLIRHPSEHARQPPGSSGPPSLRSALSLFSHIRLPDRGFTPLYAKMPHTHVPSRQSCQDIGHSRQPAEADIPFDRATLGGPARADQFVLRGVHEPRLRRDLSSRFLTSLESQKLHARRMQAGHQRN
jgi:hypothetical protein